MSSVSADAAPAAPRDPEWEWALAAAILIALARLAAIRLSPLELSAAEAHDWVLAAHPAIAYASQPPLTAWLVRLTTLMGAAEPFVRMSAPLLLAAAGLFLYAAARRLYDSRTALFALLVFELAPAVDLAGFLTGPGAPLLTALAAALWAYAALLAAPKGSWRAAAGFGFALGLAALAGWAALYTLVGVALHLFVSRTARQAWSFRAALVAAALFILAIAPTLIFAAPQGFPIFGAPEAAMAPGGLVASEALLFGPLLLLVAAAGGIWLAARRGLSAADALLLSWGAPAVVGVLVQAFVTGASLVAAAPALLAGSALAAALMLRWGRPRLLMALLALRAFALVAGFAVALYPALLQRAGQGKWLARVRGNRELVQMVVERAKIEQLSGPLAAVVAAEPRLYDLGAYYGRDYFGRDGPPLKAQAPAGGARVLVAAEDPRDASAIRARFRQAGDVDIGDIWLGAGQRREITLFVARGYLGGAPGR